MDLQAYVGKVVTIRSPLGGCFCAIVDRVWDTRNQQLEVRHSQSGSRFILDASRIVRIATVEDVAAVAAYAAKSISEQTSPMPIAE